MSPDLVSTIIPVFNRADLLRAAVGCVLAQTYRPIEIIVVDDGSTDDTPQTCRELAEAHPGVVVALRQDNAGPGAAREAGRLLARGEFIQYLDSDDWLHPRKFERQVAALREHPECGVAYCKTHEYVIGTDPGERASFRTGEWFDQLFPDLLSGRIWQTVTPLFRRTVSDAVGPWSTLRQEEDWEYDARVAVPGTRLVWVPEFLADHRHHEGPRAGGNSLNDPVKMRWRYQAHLLIYQHARRAGVGPDDPHMQRYARTLFLLARQCGAAGLAAESRELFDLAQTAVGAAASRGWDFRLYRAAAAVVGWRRAGRLACWADRWRSRGQAS
jgi:glycosyltransferase involved in cell wall biosynthesis